jgi:hypothetical protein
MPPLDEKNYYRYSKETIDALCPNLTHTKNTEHCAEPKCPECNIKTYNKGFQDGVRHATPTARKRTLYEVTKEQVKKDIKDWATNYIEEDTKLYGTDKHGIALEDLLTKLEEI